MRFLSGYSLCFFLLATLAASGSTAETGAVAQSAQRREIAWKTAYERADKYLNQGDFQEAEANFREALKLVKKQSKSFQDEVLCTKRLAATLAFQDRTGEARETYRNLLARVERRYGARSHETEPLLMALGSIEESAGNHSLAMTYYNRALKINEKNDGVYSPAYANTLSKLGRVNHRLGNRDTAVVQYKRAISILSKEPNQEAAQQLKSVMHEYGDLSKGDDHSNSQLIEDFDRDVLNRRSEEEGRSSVDSGSVKEGGIRVSERVNPVSAEASDAGLRPPINIEAKGGGSSFQQASRTRFESMGRSQTDENEKIALRGMIRPESSQSLAPAYEAVNESVFNQKRYGVTEDQYKRKIAIDIDALGGNHPSVANDMAALAQLYMEQKKYSEARELLLKALKIYDSTYGEDNLLTISATASLAQVEFALGDYERSADLYRKALGHGQKSLGPNNLETARILNGLAYLYYNQGKLSESLTFYEWAVSSTESATGSSDPLFAACLKDYARVLRSVGKESRAKEVEMRADSILAQRN
ncbi:tetratricopeptide repeat protein [bacterium]|nr:tetratricopeptide repeat protein [bacterium]